MYVIEEAKDADTSAILAVRKETWLATYPNKEYSISREDILAKDFASPEKVQQFRESATKPGIKTWVAREGGCVVGFCTVKKRPKLRRVGALYVLPEHQGKGIGQALLQTALAYLGTDRQVSLHVAVYNQKAIDFYKGMGFKMLKGIVTDKASVLPSGQVIPEKKMRHRSHS